MQALEPPGIAAHGLQVAAGPPAPQLLGPARVGDERADVTGLAAGDPVRNPDAADRTERGDQLEDGDAGAGAQVEDLQAGRVVELVQRDAVGLGHVHDVDVVADPAAVGGVVVVAVHLKALAPAHRHLHHVRQHVARHPGRVLAEQAAGMGAGRVEIAQREHGQVAMAAARVGQDLLAHQLGAGVGVHGRGLVVLGDGPAVPVTVDRAGGGEDQLPYPVFGHGGEQAGRAADVGAVIVQGDVHGLADRFPGGEVDHGIDGVLGEDLVELARVAHVDLMHGEVPAGHLPDGGDCRR